MTPAIDQQWIKEYIDQLLDLAGKLPEGPMKQATLLRVDHVMDLVEAWRKRPTKV